MKHFGLILMVFCLLLPLCALGEGEVILSDEPALNEEVELTPIPNSDAALPGEDDESDDEFLTDNVAIVDDGLMEEEDETVRPLSAGDEGSDVAELQQKLTDLHYYNGSVSGRYGEATQAAVAAFQKDFGLTETGSADARTLSTLYATMYRPLQLGSTGDDVKRLQTRLAELGFYKGKISGNYLDSTREAVSQFQATIGMGESGRADVFTQSVLFSSDALMYDAHEKLGKYETASPVPTATPGPSSAFMVDENATEPAAPLATIIPYSKRLANGSSGALVKQVQQRLTDLGFYDGPVSGNYQGKTTTAVKKFQERNGMDVSGVVGENTWNLLFNDPNVLDVLATPRPTPTPTPVPFAITVDVNNQVTTVYGRDENGDYTVVVRQMLCSTGTVANPSDVGEFVLNGRKAKWCYFPTWGSHGRYWTRINGSIAFHSVIYNSVDTMDLSVKSYKNLGKRASHGCIRLTVADSKWIYDNVGAGTVVTITEDLPADPELRASLKLPPLNYSNMLPEVTPLPTAEPLYVSGSQPPQPLKQLARYDESEAVYHLQHKLTDLGYYHGKCSGTYLEGTMNAVKDFQRDHGLRVTGTADVETLQLLYIEEFATPVPFIVEDEDDELPTPQPTQMRIPIPTPRPQS